MLMQMKCDCVDVKIPIACYLHKTFPYKRRGPHKSLIRQNAEEKLTLVLKNHRN